MKTSGYKYLAIKLRKSLRNEVPRWVVLFIDLYVTINTFVLTVLLLRFFGLRANLEFQEIIFHQVPQVLIVALIAFLLTSSYKGIIRHTGFNDVIKVFKANLLYFVLMIFVFWLTVNYFQNKSYVIGKFTILIHTLFNIVVLIFLRILYKNIFDRYIKRNRPNKRVLIYGAGASGIITYGVLKNDDKTGVCVFGFIDDKKSKSGKTINGLKVYHTENVTNEFLKKHDISEIIISAQKITSKRLNEIEDKFSESGVELKIVPAVSKWINNKLTSQQIKPVKIDDLLGRESIKLEKEEVFQEVKDKVILVTGAAGSIGSEISRQLMDYPFKKLILLDQAESALYDLQQETKSKCTDRCEYVIGNIRNPQRVDEIFNFYRPDIIYHSAAYKHVPLMEDNPYEAVMTNIGGTKLIADHAVKYGAKKFVMISTDKAVNPTNVMGATKRIAELYVSQLNKKSETNFVVTRFGNVLGSNGSVIPLFKRQIEEGGPLTVTHPDVTRYFMTIPEACQLVLDAGAMGKGGEVYVFDMGKPMKIFDLAKKVIRLSGFKYPEEIDIQFVGLRPGEKICEELLSDNESMLKTHNPKIMIAKVCGPSDSFENRLEQLLNPDLTQNPDKINLEMVSVIKELVPEYVSQNSVFSTLDKQHN